jgi:lipid-A-disaccharide synthase
MRYFFSSGEASGEFAAVLLARSIRAIDSGASLEGIGGDRMRAEGFTLWRDHRGWATLGPLAAIPRAPRLYREMIAAAAHIEETNPDIVVLVDFGAFNVRLAQRLRKAGYAGPIVDLFPPGAWLDRASAARAVGAVATPVTAFTHQRDFFRSLGVPVWYFGHPLISQYELRPARPAAPANGGTIAVLPGSRRSEIRHHAPVVFAAYERLRRTRPNLRAIVGAAHDDIDRELRSYAGDRAASISFVRGAHDAIAGADAAWVASGTAVLECALWGVPLVGFYKVSPLLARYARSIYGGRFFTIPNLVLQREAVPELLQQAVTPENLAQAMDGVLREPQKQRAAFAELHEALGPHDATDRIARFCVELAGTKR